MLNLRLKISQNCSNPIFMGRIATPNQIFGENLYDWWDFTDLATQSIAGGGQINSITSKGTNAGVFASSGTNRPQSIVGVNGLNVADFDGVNDFMEVAASTGMYNFLHNAEGGLIVAVFKSEKLGEGNRLIGNRGSFQGGQDTASGFLLANGTSNGNLVIVSNNQGDLTSAAVIFVSTADGTITEAWQSSLSVLDPSQPIAEDRGKIILDGGLPVANNTYTNALFDGNAQWNLTLGRRVRINDQYFGGKLSEIFIIRGVANVTPTTLAQTQQYLTSKYGGTFPIV
jgi:hypothetical protein